MKGGVVVSNESVFCGKLLLFYYRYLLGKSLLGLKGAKAARIKRERVLQLVENFRPNLLLKNSLKAMKGFVEDIRKEKALSKEIAVKVVAFRRIQRIVKNLRNQRISQKFHDTSMKRKGLKGFYLELAEKQQERKNDILAYRYFRKTGLRNCFTALKSQKANELIYEQNLERNALNFRGSKLLTIQRLAFLSLEANILGRGYDIRHQLRKFQKQRLLKEWSAITKRSLTVAKLVDNMCLKRKKHMFTELCSALRKQRRDKQMGAIIQNKCRLRTLSTYFTEMHAEYQHLQKLYELEAELGKRLEIRRKRSFLTIWVDKYKEQYIRSKLRRDTLLRLFFRAAKRTLAVQRSTYDKELLTRRFRSRWLRKHLFSLLSDITSVARKDKQQTARSEQHYKQRVLKHFVSVASALRRLRLTGDKINKMWSRKVFRMWRGQTVDVLLEARSRREELGRAFRGWRDRGQKEGKLIVEKRRERVAKRAVEGLQWWMQACVWGRYQNLRASAFLGMLSKRLVFRRLRVASKFSFGLSSKVEEFGTSRALLSAFDSWRKVFTTLQMDSRATEYHLSRWSNKLKSKSFSALRLWRERESERMQQERDALKHYYQMAKAGIVEEILRKTASYVDQRAWTPSLVEIKEHEMKLLNDPAFKIGGDSLQFGPKHVEVANFFINKETRHSKFDNFRDQNRHPQQVSPQDQSPNHPNHMSKPNPPPQRLNPSLPTGKAGESLLATMLAEYRSLNDRLRQIDTALLMAGHGDTRDLVEQLHADKNELSVEVSKLRERIQGVYFALKGQ